MSLYRQHQHLSRMVEWAETARIALPVTVIADMAGVVDVGTGAGGHILVLAGAAAISWLGWKWRKRAKAALSKFEQRVSRSSSLSAIYKVDAHDGQIADLRAEMATSLTLAAMEAKRGNAVIAGLAVGHAKTIESRLRQRGA